MAASQQNGNAETNGDPKSDIPEWVKTELFEEVLKNTVPGYKETKSFKASRALAAGENYATIMLRVEIDVALETGETKAVTYMLKLPHDLEIYNQMLEKLNIFDVENGMYLEIVPEFEQMYRDVGVDVKFGAKSYKLKTDHFNVLLQDLRPFGFKNTNRLEGLDMEHTKSVLKKLAMWHAASATRVNTKGNYADIYMNGFFREEFYPIMKGMFDSFTTPFMNAIKSYKGHEVYLDAVENLTSKSTKIYLNLHSQSDDDEFKVLNHGDCWSNNIMFQYDDNGKIKETYFVDYQIAKYGTPAQDLLYFLLSSTKYEIKLNQFDYFIKFYHDHLFENLTLLKYPKKLPMLKDIHVALFKYGFLGYQTVTTVMAAILVDPTEKASFDNFLGDSADAVDFKNLMYSNDRYRKHMEMILPWLYNRGALDI